MTFTKAIIKSEYLPPISTFWAAHNSDVVLLEVNENYQKKSSRNRAKILGVNGIDVLSVPLQKGKNNNMPITEVAISYHENWQTKHLNSIKSAYGNAPFFEYYFDDIEQILKNKYDLLIDLNQSLFSFFNKSINLDISIQKTSMYTKDYADSDCDLRFMKFNQKEIKGYTVKKYNQVFEEKHGFIGGISILDLLMCKGPESILYI
jgi:hypothetical protein